MDQLDEAITHVKIAAKTLDGINAQASLHRAVAELTIAVGSICNWLKSQSSLERNLPGGK